MFACTVVNGPYSIVTTSSDCYTWNSGDFNIGSTGSIAPISSSTTIESSLPIGTLTNDGSIYNNVTGNSVSALHFKNDMIGLVNNAGGLIQNSNNNNTIFIEIGLLSTLTNAGQIVNNATSASSGAINVYPRGGITNFNNLDTGQIIATSTNGGAAIQIDSGYITNFNNAGSINGIGNRAIEMLDPAYINILNNSGSITSVGSVALNMQGGANINTLNNSGSINSIGAIAINMANVANINTLNNYGSISAGESGFEVYYGSYISTLNNFGAITSTGSNAIGVGLGGSISNINNSGTISNTSTVGGNSYWAANDGGSAIYNSGHMRSLTNTGSIYTTASGAFGIYNNANTAYDTVGQIDTLNNAQGAGNARGPLTYTGTLPTNYNIIINSLSSFGRLAVTDGVGSTIFGISPLSANLGGFFGSVLTGVSNTQLGITGLIQAGVSNGYNFRLVQTAENSGIWDLRISSIITAPGQLYPSSTLGVLVLPVFDGGTLQVSAPGTIPNNFTVNSNNGVIDQRGVISTFSGGISNEESNVAGSITIINSNNGGKVIFSGPNTYTGSTTIDSGATLALSGSSSLANSSGVVANGTFDVSTTTGNTTVKSISGSGALELGSQRLSISNASGNLSGVVSGTGGLNILAGNQTLSGNNAATFSGGIQVQAGAYLTIPNSNALGTGTLDLIGSSTTPATLITTADVTISNPITVSGDPVLSSAPGFTQRILSPITDGISPGDVVVSGGGTVSLEAVNTYTLLTRIDAGSTLALSGAGSIATSSNVSNNGTLNLTGKTGNVSLANYSQSATGTLAMNFTPSGNQQLNVIGPTSLGGNLALTATAGRYAAGRYTILTSTGPVTGTFGSLSTNLRSYGVTSYALSYGTFEVFLNLLAGPSKEDTQQSLVNTAAALQNTFTLQNTVLANSFAYDCSEFGAKGVCISVGGRNTAVQAANGLNNTSGLLIAAYRPHPKYRIGAYVDQNLSVSNPGGTVNLGNNTPLIGLFGVWNQKLDGTGIEVKVSAAYGQKNTTVTRSVVGTSEPGSGSSQLVSQGTQVTAKYGFAVTDKAVVSPYIGLRYTQNNMGGYTEGTSSTVTAPLTYSALNTNATTVLAGVGTSYKVIPTVITFAIVGVETDTNTANGSYSGTNSTITGLTPVNFNANPVKTRPTATLGAYYDIVKNQRLGITGIYRQEAYQAVSSTTVMATYTVGL